MSEIELKPCPFCGGEATNHAKFVVGCMKCDAWLDTAEEWNTRTDRESALVAALERITYYASGHDAHESAIGANG